jgi:hypothetical protein
MLDVLHFIFRDFITWLGTVILVLCVSCGFRVVEINHWDARRAAERGGEDALHD